MQSVTVNTYIQAFLIYLRDIPESTFTDLYVCLRSYQIFSRVAVQFRIPTSNVHEF